MKQIGRRIETIPLDQLKHVDDLFFRQIKMDEERTMKKFPVLFEKTREEMYKKVSCQGVFQIFDLERVDEEAVYVNGGEVMESAMLARVMAKSSRAAVYAVTVHGHEELDEATEDLRWKFFYDAWGTAFVEAATVWLREKIMRIAENEALYATQFWCPGQHNVDISLQENVFRLIDPERIGIHLKETMMMHPKKSATGIAGLGTDPDLESVRACDVCELRETCPSAYAVEI